MARATTSTNGVKLDITKGTHYIAFTEDFIEDVNVSDGGTLASMKGNNSTVLTNLDIDVADGGIVGTGTEFVEASSIISFADKTSAQTIANVGLKGTGNTVGANAARLLSLMAVALVVPMALLTRYITTMVLQLAKCLKLMGWCV